MLKNMSLWNLKNPSDVQHKTICVDRSMCILITLSLRFLDYILYLVNSKDKFFSGSLFWLLLLHPLKKYYSNMQSATNQYYRTYEKERHSILEEDNLNRAKTIEELTFQLNDAEKALASLSSVIDQENIVGESMKNISDVSALIEIFSNQRADSIKEAINVLYEDKHRKKMEALLKEQVRLTQEARDIAEDAQQVAYDASEQARIAYRKAEQALDRADDAYREAQDAASDARDALSRVD